MNTTKRLFQRCMNNSATLCIYPINLRKDILRRPFSLLKMGKNCEKCSQTINTDTDLYTVCEGKCAKWFHARCVGVTESDLCTLSSNILWFCDTCMTWLCKTRDRIIVDATSNTEPSRAMEDEIRELKCTVAEIARTLAEVVRKPGPVAPDRHSTPIASPKLRDVPNEIACHTLQADESKSEGFALYLSNIDNTATENDISMMVSHSLGAPLPTCTNVVKLVPKWKQINSMDYVSFKVLLDTKLRPLALKESTWPKGIKFREFVSRANETWKPNSFETL